jgi:hypothetical protein
MLLIPYAEQDGRVIAFVSSLIGLSHRWDPEGCTTLGLRSLSGRLWAGAIYHHYCGFDIQIEFAARDARWASRPHIGCFIAYPFTEIGCERMTALVHPDNARSRKLLEGIGFQVEGRIRKGYDGESDALLYGLLREDGMRWVKAWHRWLEQWEVSDGQRWQRSKSA